MPDYPRRPADEADEFDDELSPEERVALSALPRARVPSAELEERVVRSLRAQGLLASPRGGVRQFGRSAAAAAAGVLLFAGGVALGHTLAARSGAEMLAAVREGDARATASLVQQTGSAYVAALSALADRHGTGALDAADAGQGSEAALVALRAAAEELVRLDPDNAMAHHLVRLLDDAGPSGDPAAEPLRQVIWY